MESITKSKKHKKVNWLTTRLEKLMVFLDFKSLKVFLELRNMSLGGGFVKQVDLSRGEGIR